MTDLAVPVIRAAKSRRRRGIAGVSPRMIAAFLIPFFLPFVLFYIVPIIYALCQSMLVVRRTAGEFGT
ncbi:MAG: multiple sugar transport system permease protein, partial [Actinomycetota bacterium]|nr:multiple sugar transport system permease protein [Actinomycetota bacterium]